MAKSPLRVVLCYPAEPRHVEAISATLAEAGVDAEVVNAGQERIADELPEADIFCGHAKVPVPWEEVVRRGRLRWIQSSAAGMDHCLVEPVIASDIAVSSASGLLADQVAEQTFALLLGLLRGLPRFFRAQLAREFVRLPTADLHGARVTIVGLGGNGRRLVEALAPFHTSIRATDWFPEDQPAEVEQLLPADGLDDLLPETDVLILAAPLNGETRGMIDRDRLERMPRGSWLVNVARGPLVVERDLVAALESGRLAGAGVDVTEVEPLPVSSPLWDRSDVIITPHVGGQAATRIDDATSLFCANIRRYLAKQPLLNSVDKTLGFPHPKDAAWRLGDRLER